MGGQPAGNNRGEGDQSLPHAGTTSDPEQMRAIFQRHLRSPEGKEYEVRGCDVSFLLHARNVRFVAHYELRLVEAGGGRGWRVGDALAADGFRVEVDGRGERMRAKIRDAQLQKVPYTLVVGNREAQAGGASVRLRAGEDLGMIGLSELRDRLRQAVATRGTP